MRRINRRVNARAAVLDIDAEAMPLLYAWRGDFGLTGPQDGRGQRKRRAWSSLS